MEWLFAIQPPMPQTKTRLEVLLVSSHVAAANYSAFSEAISFRLRDSPRSRHSQLCGQYLTWVPLRSCDHVSVGKITPRAPALKNSQHFGNRVAAIVILHVSSGPPTVLWRVVAIIVNPVEAVHGRSWTHGSKKVLKAIPPIAHLNSAPTQVRPP